MDTSDGVGVRGFAIDGYTQLLAEGHELVDGSRALEVGGDEEGRLAVASKLEGQLGGGGGLTGALETCQEDDAGGGVGRLKTVALGAEDVG